MGARPELPVSAAFGPVYLLFFSMAGFYSSAIITGTVTRIDFR